MMDTDSESNAMTVIGRDTTSAVICSELRGISRIQTMESSSDVEERIEILGRDAGKATLSLLRYRFPGDKFSQVYSGFIDLVRGSSLDDHFLQVIRNFELAIGIVFSPPCFIDNDWRFDIPFAIADLIGGYIFNGAVFVDPQGNVVLDISE